MGLFSSIFKAVPVVGDIISANQSKKATKKASAAQVAALNAAIKSLNDQFGITSGNLNGTISAGNKAVGGISELLGLGGDQAGAIDALKGSPLYESLFNNGRDAILGSASATGGLRGGNVNAALGDFGRDTLAQVIQQQLSNLGGLASLGQNASLGLGQLGASNAQSIANLNAGIGNAQAGSILGVQGIDNNLFSGLRQTVASLAGGFAGGGAGGAGGLGSILGSLFSSAGAGGGGGTLSGSFPAIIGASNNPINLGTIDTTPLIQKIGF